jgi:hypothetical protein
MSLRLAVDASGVRSTVNAFRDALNEEGQL